MYERILIANRGEIAVRIARTCRALGVESVAVYSDADARSRHIAVADQAVYLTGVAPSGTYLSFEAILAAVRVTGAEAVHPGYGFLAENADFAEAVIGAGFDWIGPPPRATRAVGDKIEARRIAREAGIPIVPGMLEPVSEAAAVEAFAAEHGYPIAVKAAGGGGGRGLKVARGPRDVTGALESARREARAYFGTAAVYVERYLDSPKHLEVQILAPNPDEALWLGVRDCSLQRRHQKLVEETPPPRWGERAQEMGEAAVALSKACGYVNAGTIEMLVDHEGEFHFLEVNARLQVEHTVTEEIYGLDLVECQLKIAAGEALGFTQDDLTARGHSIECRINAENPAFDFAPAPGVITRYREPGGPGVRVDAGYGEGDEIPEAYDSLVAKVVTWGVDRDQALDRMKSALEDYHIEGVPTTIAAHRILLRHPDFRAGTHTTTTVAAAGLAKLAAPAEREARDVLIIENRPVRLWNPAMAPSAAAAVHEGAASGEVRAPMQGTVLKVFASAGQQVHAGEALIVLEAMKMETTIAAARSGTVVTVNAVAGQATTPGEVLAVIE